MKHLKYLTISCSLLTVGIGQAIAQTASSSSDAEETIELSPFTVDASQDVGYHANSTTVGSRLNTQLRDVAASVTVLTDAFMDDLGATDVATALSMVAGVETDLTTDRTEPHLGQGFLGNDFGDPTTRIGGIRVRGLGRATQSANYLEIAGPIDRYNMDRTEFLRGPNALLFGLGTPGGVVNYTTKRAHLSKELNRIENVFDNFGTTRTVADFSRVLIEDKLAVRAVGMYQDERYMFKTAQNRDKRLFLTSTFKPFKNTTITAYYENINVDGRRPNYRIPQDNVSDWLREYNKAHEMYSGQELENFLNRNLLWDASWSTTSNGRAGVSPDILITERIRTNPDGSPLVTAGEFRRQNDVRTNAFTGFFTPETGWDVPYNNMWTRYGTTTISGGNARNSNPRARLEMHRSSFGNDRRDQAYLDPQVLDENIWPFMDYEISSLPGNRKFIEDDKFFIGLEQKIADDLYLSVSYQEEDYYDDQVFAPLAQSHAISLDINRYLPGSLDNAGAFTGSNRNGLTLDEAVAEAQTIIADPSTSAADVASNQTFLQSVANREPNPNFLRPFLHGRNIGGVNELKTEAYLAQMNYDFDFKEKFDHKLLGMLGFHRLTGFASGNSNLNHSWRFTGAAEYTPGVLEDDRGSERPARWFVPVMYLGDAVQPGDTGLNITGIPGTTNPGRGTSLPYYGFDNSNSNRGEWGVAGNTQWRRHTIERTATLTEIDASAWGGSLQSFFWNRRIVTSLGYRKDTVENFEYVRWDVPTLASNPLVIAERERRGLGTAAGDFIRYDEFGDGTNDSDFILHTPTSTQRGTEALSTRSIVFHATPWLRGFYNESENFELTEPSNDGFNRTNPPQSGETEEYGIGISLWDNKVDIRLSAYETSQRNQPSGAIRLEGRLNSFEGALFRTLSALDQRRQDGEATAYDISDWQVITGLDSNGDAIIEFPGTRIQETDADGNLVFDDQGRARYEHDGEFNPVTNPGVTQDSVSEGWELSGTFNPTRNLRIFANVSKLDNRRSNLERQVLEYMDKRSPYWAPFFSAGYHTNGDNDQTVYIPVDDPRALDPNFVPGDNVRIGDPAPLDSLLIDDFYNALGVELLDAIRDDGTSNIGVSEYNARFTANYSFYEGFLKGFSVGTNLRWESGKVFGYPVIQRDLSDLPAGFPNPDLNGNGAIDANEFNLVKDDVSRPYTSDSFVTGGVMVGYRTKLFNDKVNWRIQLNVNNLFKQGGDLRVIRLNPDQSPIYGINVPTTYRLSSSISW